MSNYEDELNRIKQTYLNDAGADGYDNGTATRDNPQGSNTTISSVSGANFAATAGTADWVTQNAIDRHNQDVTKITNIKNNGYQLGQTFSHDSGHDKTLANDTAAYNAASDTANKQSWEHIFEYDATRLSGHTVNDHDGAVNVENDFKGRLPTEKGNISNDQGVINSDEKGWKPGADINNLLIEEAQADDASTDNKTDDGNDLLSKAKQVANSVGDHNQAVGFRNAGDADTYVKAAEEQLKPYGADSTNVANAANALSISSKQFSNDISAAKQQLQKDEHANVAPDLKLTKQDFDSRYNELKNFLPQLQSDMYTYGHNVDPYNPRSLTTHYSQYDNRIVKKYGAGSVASSEAGEMDLMNRTLDEAYPRAASLEASPIVHLSDIESELSPSDISKLQQDLNTFKKEGHQTPHTTVKDIESYEKTATQKLVNDDTTYSLYHEALSDYAKVDYESLVFGNQSLEGDIKDGTLHGEDIPDLQIEKANAEHLIADTARLNHLLTGTDKGFVMQGGYGLGMIVRQIPTSQTIKMIRL